MKIKFSIGFTIGWVIGMTLQAVVIPNLSSDWWAIQLIGLSTCLILWFFTHYKIVKKETNNEKTSQA